MDELTPSERKSRLASVKKRLGALNGTAAKALWEYGSLFREVRDHELWKDDGSESFADWLEVEMGYSRETARRAMIVSEHFTAEMAERFGIDKLAAAVRYMAATGRDEKPGDVLALRIRVRGERGSFTTVPFPDATYRQIAEAIKLVKGAAAGDDFEVDEETAAKVERLVDALPAAPEGVKAGERVRFEKGTDGRVAVSFIGIPVDELESALKAIRKHLVG